MTQLVGRGNKKNLYIRSFLFFPVEWRNSPTTTTTRFSKFFLYRSFNLDLILELTQFIFPSFFISYHISTSELKTDTKMANRTKLINLSKYTAVNNIRIMIIRMASSITSIHRCWCGEVKVRHRPSTIDGPDQTI